MAAYLISDVTVKNAAAFETYRTRAAASIAQYGGRYLVRGGRSRRWRAAGRRARSSWSSSPTSTGRAPGIARPNMPRRWRSATRRSAATSSWSTASARPESGSGADFRSFRILRYPLCLTFGVHALPAEFRLSGIPGISDRERSVEAKPHPLWIGPPPQHRACPTRSRPLSNGRRFARDDGRNASWQAAAGASGMPGAYANG